MPLKRLASIVVAVCAWASAGILGLTGIAFGLCAFFLFTSKNGGPSRNLLGQNMDDWNGIPLSVSAVWTALDFTVFLVFMLSAAWLWTFAGRKWGGGKPTKPPR